MKQNTFLEALSSKLIERIEVIKAFPCKGKRLDSNKPIWTVMIVLENGNVSPLVSTRGSKREWASLDRLNTWLNNHGINDYRISSEGL